MILPESHNLVQSSNPPRRVSCVVILGVWESVLGSQVYLIANRWLGRAEAVWNLFILIAEGKDFIFDLNRKTMK